MSNLAFIGLGNMGAPMAANLVKGGHHVLGFDLSEEARRNARIAIAASATEAVASADVVVLMLPAGRHVESVAASILPALRKGTLLIDSSTIDVATAKKVHGLAAERAIPCLDAPVSGGVGCAVAGTLTFMVGGTAEAFRQAEPILSVMGKRIVHCGPGGAGQAAKICNNMIAGISMIAVSEAFALAAKLGLSSRALFDVASASSGQCWALTSYCPVAGLVPNSPANFDFKPGFAAELMLKDLRLAQEAAGAVTADTPLGAEAAVLFARFVQSGGGTKDFSGIVRLFDRDRALEPTH
jgi:3-hydroxyisobutyrate dehydrogenase